MASSLTSCKLRRPTGCTHIFHEAHKSSSLTVAHTRDTSILTRSTCFLAFQWTQLPISQRPKVVPSPSTPVSPSEYGQSIHSSEHIVHLLSPPLLAMCAVPPGCLSMGHMGRLCGSHAQFPHKPLSPSLALLVPLASFFRTPLPEGLSNSTELAPGSLPAPGSWHPVWTQYILVE